MIPHFRRVRRILQMLAGLALLFVAVLGQRWVESTRAAAVAQAIPQAGQIPSVSIVPGPVVVPRSFQGDVRSLPPAPAGRDRIFPAPREIEYDPTRYKPPLG